jgi:glutaredoxin
MNKSKIEIFTAGCPLCNSVVGMVKELASEWSYELIIYDLVKQYENKECKTRVELYNVKRLPSVVVDGKLLACCTNQDITSQDLITAGIGKNVIL